MIKIAIVGEIGFENFISKLFYIQFLMSDEVVEIYKKNRNVLINLRKFQTN